MDRKYIHPRKKYFIKKFNNFICTRCNQEKSPEELEIDHKIPISIGGDNEYSNLFPLCIECHLDKTSEEWKKGFFRSNDLKKIDKLNPSEKLEILKEFLNENKAKDYAELSFMVYNHPILSTFSYNTTILYKMWKQLNGYGSGKSMSSAQVRLREQRDLMVWLFRKYTKLKYREIENILLDYEFAMSFQQISKICNKFEGLIINPKIEEKI